MSKRGFRDKYKNCTCWRKLRRMKGYGQFCPVAKATEVLGEKWTPLIIRELISDEQSFNNLRKGVPLMSPSLLSSRLKTLEHAGVIERNKTDDGVIYSLTEAGSELAPVIEQLGVWGQRWVRSDMSKKDLDPSLLMWDAHRRIDTSFFPDGRSVLRFEFVDYPSKMRLWWLVVTDGEVDICLKDPGYEVTLYVKSTLKSMTQVWVGDMSIARARREKLVQLNGDTALKNTMTSWIGRSLLADIKPA
jgi:DNA-binding HxlR family transcriptional regulator